MTPLFTAKVLVIVLGGLPCLILAGLFIWENVIKPIRSGAEIRRNELKLLKQLEDELKRPTLAPPSLRTNYLLQEGFMTLVIKSENHYAIDIHTPLAKHFEVVQWTGSFDATLCLHNKYTGEHTPITQEFIRTWGRPPQA